MIFLDLPRSVCAATAMALAAVLMVAATGCHGDASRGGVLSTTEAVTGTVATNWGDPVAGARVFLVPTDQVPTTPITSADVLSGAADAYDEPLEDAVASAAAATFPQATTDATGAFSIAAVDTTRSYYPFVDTAAAQPADLYPGGDLSRRSRSGAALSGMTIQVTGRPSDNATYVGSSVCVLCHSDFSAQKVHAHRLGFRRPGVTSPLQSLARKPDFDDALASFTPATMATAKTAGTPLWFHDFDGGRGFDKFVVARTDPGNAEIVVYLWRDSTSFDYMVTMENLVNPGDPDRTYAIDLTYGGALYKQRFMLRVDDPGYAGLYPFLQYQHAGDDAYYDRTRRVFRDYHMDFFWDAGTQTFALPPKDKNIESNCMACHATGYRYFDDPASGVRLSDAVDDPAGVYDIDRDGSTDEINTGCEVCHGPGSEHVAFFGPRYIVQPKLLSPSRENQICGRCHDRVLGNDDRQNEQPLNAAGEMAPPGTSRAEFLTDYTSRKGPALSSFWQDEFHSKSHHQQYTDFIKSAHYRNGRVLVACSDCHDPHGMGAHDGELRGDPADGELCATCHAVDIEEHLVDTTGSLKLGTATECTSCHYYKTAKTGAGRQGILLGNPTGGSGDENITYWENDISSHHTVVPSQTNPGVSGVLPGKAMPVPYTNACGSCHDARFLQFPR